MEAVGRLAGGVAHDFNNSLGVILGYTELLMRQAGEAQRGKLEQILKATQRASGLTRQLLAFSRKQIVDPKVLDLNALLSDLEKMLGRLIGEDIDLAIVPGAGPRPGEGRPGAAGAGGDEPVRERPGRHAGRRAAAHRDRQRRAGRGPCRPARAHGRRAAT